MTCDSVVHNAEFMDGCNGVENLNHIKQDFQHGQGGLGRLVYSISQIVEFARRAASLQIAPQGTAAQVILELYLLRMGLSGLTSLSADRMLLPE